MSEPANDVAARAGATAHNMRTGANIPRHIIAVRLEEAGDTIERLTKELSEAKAELVDAARWERDARRVLKDADRRETMTRDQILRLIDEATEPKAMSEQDALDWLEELAADIDGRIDALRDQMKSG